MYRLALLAIAIYVGTIMPTLAASRTYDLQPFEAVSVAQGITAIVDVGGEQSVRAEASSEAMLDRLDVHVENNRLRIGIDGNFLGWLLDLGHWHETITVHVSAPRIVAAYGSSGANVDLNHATGSALTVEASSGASVAAQVAMEGGLVLGASSGGNLRITGICAHLVANASSGGNVDAGKLTCKDATADSSSGGHLRLDATDSLVANASSGGAIDVARRPSSTNVNTSSGGAVRFDQ